MQLIAKTRLEELQLRKLLDCIRTKNKEAIAKIITSGLPDLVNYIENDPEGIGKLYSINPPPPPPSKLISLVGITFTPSPPPPPARTHTYTHTHTHTHTHPHFSCHTTFTPPPPEKFGELKDFAEKASTE